MGLRLSFAEPTPTPPSRAKRMRQRLQGTAGGLGRTGAPCGQPGTDGEQARRQPGQRRRRTHRCDEDDQRTTKLLHRTAGCEGRAEKRPHPLQQMPSPNRSSAGSPQTAARARAGGRHDRAAIFPTFFAFPRDRERNETLSRKPGFTPVSASVMVRLSVCESPNLTNVRTVFGTDAAKPVLIIL